MKFLIPFIIVLIGFSNCNRPPQYDNNTILECILDSYLSKYNVATNDYIHVGNGQNWTDSTFNMVIIFDSKRDWYPPEGDSIFYTKYKGVDVYLYHCALYFSKDSVSKCKTLGYSETVIPNSLEWTMLGESTVEPDEDLIVPPHSPHEIQIEYSPSKKCLMVDDHIFQRLIDVEPYIMKHCAICE